MIAESADKAEAFLLCWFLGMSTNIDTVVVIMKLSSEDVAWQFPKWIALKAVSWDILGSYASFQELGALYYRPKTKGLLFQGHPQKGLPICGNSHISDSQESKVRPSSLLKACSVSHWVLPKRSIWIASRLGSTSYPKQLKFNLQPLIAPKKAFRSGSTAVWVLSLPAIKLGWRERSAPELLCHQLQPACQAASTSRDRLGANPMQMRAIAKTPRQSGWVGVNRHFRSGSMRVVL